MSAPLAAALVLALGAAPADPPDARRDVPAGADGFTPVELRQDSPRNFRNPGGPHRLRAATEIGTWLVLDWSLMLFTPPPAADPPGDVSVWKKLSLQGVRYDVSAFPTNFVLHPLAGTLYYGAARSNGLGAFESFGWAVASSTVWELAEYPEVFSINDEVVTPVAGAALGECFFQLASWLDRGPRGLGKTALGWVLAPVKKLDDALDGATLERGAPDGALEVRQALTTGVTRGAKGFRPELRLGLGTRLVRDPDYGKPGHALHADLDGGVTELAVDVAAAQGGLSDFRLAAQAWFATLYQRALAAGPGGRVSGVDLLLGLGPGYELRLHDWDRARAQPLDALSVVHVPGALAELRVFSGAAELRARVEVAASFGGTRSLALDRGASGLDAEALPTPQQAWGYHFGIGPSLAPSLEARLGPASLAVSARCDALTGILARDVEPGFHPTARLADSQTRFAGRAAYRFPWRGLELSAQLERGLRWSRAGETTANAAETRFGLGLGFSGDPL
jgi:hypothetical protein